MAYKTQVDYTIEILEEADKEIINLYDSYGAGNEELMDFVREEIGKLIQKVINKKWYDDIGQSI